MCNTILRNHIQELQQTKPSAITTYANIPRVDRFCRFFIRLVSFILDRRRLIYVLNSDTGMSLSDRKLASKEIHSFRTL